MGSRPIPGKPQRPIVEKISTDRVDQYLPYQPPDQRALNGAAVYLVDELTRPVKAEGWMYSKGAPRTSAQHDLTGAGAPYHGLRAGHLLPAARGGSGDWFNLVPITFEVNNSQAASIESLIGTHVRNQGLIFLQVYVRYTGQNHIPDELTYYVYGIAPNGTPRLIEKRQIGGASPVYWS